MLMMSFTGKSFDSIFLIAMWKLIIDKFGVIHRGRMKCCENCFKSFVMIKYTYLAYLKVSMWFVSALDDLIVFMVYWTEAYPEPCQTSKMDLFRK